MATPEARLRYATVWERQDATLRDITDAGGLAGSAPWGSRAFRLGDLARCMQQLGVLYGRLHEQGLVYTDPKPGNIALVRAPAQFSATATTTGASAATTTATLTAASDDPWGVRASSIQRLVFIDAEAMQRPGYQVDASQRASTNLTPMYTCEHILAQIFIGEDAIKRAQADPRSDVQHMALLSYALVAGTPPQHGIARARMGERCEARQGLSPRENARIAIAEMRQVRREIGFAREHTHLAVLARQRRLPRQLGGIISDALEGRIATPKEWLLRTNEAIGGEPRAGS